MADLTQCMFYVWPKYDQGMAYAQSAATKLHCDGILTIFWWMTLKLTTGEGAVVIEPDGQYSTSAVVGGVTYTMPQADINKLVPYSAIADKIPPPPVIP
jgi:hypothetical protein